MIYLPRLVYYFLLFLIAISVGLSGLSITAIVSGIFLYLPISFSVWLFSTIYEKIFRPVGHVIDSTNKKLMYVTLVIAALLLAFGFTQPSSKLSAYGIAALLLSIEQVIRIRERKHLVKNSRNA